MSQVTTYKCDLCGKEQDNQGQMWTIALFVKNGCTAYVGQGDYPKKKTDWCRACMEIYSLLPTVEIKPDKVIQPPPTIEDIIRDLVRDELGSL